MKVRAKADFYGSIKMDKDETREIENDPVISDLLKMGLIEILMNRKAVSQMRVSEIDEDYLVNYLKLDEPDDDDIKFAQTCLDAAKSFIRGQTGLDDEQIDAYEDITIAVLVLTQDMYDNRRLYVEKSNVNKVVDSIIYQYAENWL